MSYVVRNVVEVSEGEGVDVKRLFPLKKFMNFDPFVLWDHFDIGSGRGFPDHPHRGFEAITYMFEGGMNHKDNLGNESFVSAGGAQRFTAGKGIVHSEMPSVKSHNNGIQLWINLPQKLKKISPSYQQVNNNEFPVNDIDGGKVKVIVGNGSPIVLQTDVHYRQVNLQVQARYDVNLMSENARLPMKCIVYLIKGKLKILDNELNIGQSLFVTDESGLTVSAVEKSEFMLCFGLPHNEPIHQNGSFVD